MLVSTGNPFYNKGFYGALFFQGKALKNKITSFFSLSFFIFLNIF